MDRFNRNITESFKIDSTIGDEVCCVDTWTKVCLIFIVVSIFYILLL